MRCRYDENPKSLIAVCAEDSSFHFHHAVEAYIDCVEKDIEVVNVTECGCQDISQ